MSDEPLRCRRDDLRRRRRHVVVIEPAGDKRRPQLGLALLVAHCSQAWVWRPQSSRSQPLSLERRASTSARLRARACGRAVMGVGEGLVTDAAGGRVWSTHSLTPWRGARGALGGAVTPRRLLQVWPEAV